MFDSVKKYEYEDLFDKYYSNPVKCLLTDNWREHKEDGTIDENFLVWLDVICIWATKPTLFKRFHSRLNNYVP